jgi:hypothetical protein
MPRDSIYWFDRIMLCLLEHEKDMIGPMLDELIKAAKNEGREEYRNSIENTHENNGEYDD